jgi:hypothetical protein
MPSMNGVIRRVTVLAAAVTGLLAAAPAMGVEGDEDSLADRFRELRADIGSARSAIENRVLNAEARQAERIDAVKERVDALEGGQEMAPAAQPLLHPREVTWGVVLGGLALLILAVTAWTAVRRYSAAREKERGVRYAEWETRKLEAQLREQQLFAYEKEQRWSRISFLFAQAQGLLEDRALLEVLDMLEHPERQGPLSEVLRKLGVSELDAEETRLLRALDRLLDRLELIAMAWKGEVITVHEIGVFARYLAHVDRAKLPELRRYCADRYPLTLALAKACAGLQPQALPASPLR